MAGPLHAGRPHVVRYTISGNRLTGENGLGTDKVWAHPSGHVVFTIQNDDDTDYRVRIPGNEFNPSLHFGGDAPADPIARNVLIRHEEVVVGAQNIEVIMLKIKPPRHFHFGEPDRPPAYTYKYTVYWADENDGSKPEQNSDPDLEISP